MDWFRWHHGSVTDPKFQLVARKAGASLPDVLAVWAYILEQASASEDRGQFGSIDCEAVDCMFGFPSTETRTLDIITAMRGRGLLESDRVAAWDKRQPKREREGDKSTERVRAFRERQSHETPRNATERQETPRGEERREEEIHPPTPQGGRFAEFWEAWPKHPRKAAKPQCERKWRTKGCDAMADQILAALRQQRGSHDWTRNGGEFIPAPFVWLKQARWEAPAETTADTRAVDAVAETKAMLEKQAKPLTPEEKAKADEARQRAMKAIRRVA